MLTGGKTLNYLRMIGSLTERICDLDRNLMAAITAAVQIYIETDEKSVKKRFGPIVSPWKMGSRRETMSRNVFTERRNPTRVRLRRFSLL